MNSSWPHGPVHSATRDSLISSTTNSDICIIFPRWLNKPHVPQVEKRQSENRLHSVMVRTGYRGGCFSDRESGSTWYACVCTNSCRLSPSPLRRLSIYLSIYLSNYLSICLSVYRSIHPFIYLSISSRLHTVGITGILNICCHIITMDDNTF